jgi:hypothetical protein
VHRLWHAAVLGSTLLAACGVLLLVLMPLLFEDPPPGLGRARPVVVALVGVATALVGVEWLIVHERFL